jgi:hypothetical protein
MTISFQQNVSPGERTLKAILGLFATLALVSAFASASSHAETYDVRPDGTGDFPTIQAAIDAAQDGDVIELANGSFTGDGNWDLSFRGKAITVRSKSGDPNLCRIHLQGTPHRGFIFESGEGSESFLSGIKIGYSYEVDGPGGGILCRFGSSPTVQNCVIYSCNAKYGYPGGGVSCSWSSPTFSECTFTGNSGTSGGGVESTDSFLTFNDCVFWNNATDGGSGGGMQILRGAVRLTGCLFDRNGADELGGAVNSVDAHLELTDCVFIKNEVWHAGGGAISCSGGDLDLQFCSFLENYGDFGPTTIRCPDAPAVLRNCTFYGNWGYQLPGPVMALGGDSEVRQTIIAFNPIGVPIQCGDGPVELSCCDIYGNEDGNWVGCIGSQFGVNGNISEDPIFCDAENGDLTLRSDSPCLPWTPPNEECDLIGAWPLGCAASSVPEPESVVSTTWGRIKVSSQ